MQAEIETLVELGRANLQHGRHGKVPDRRNGRGSARVGLEELVDCNEDAETGMDDAAAEVEG